MSTRTLPKRSNPLITPDVCPAYDELLSRRRLGKTNLAVKPGQVGTSNATKPENLGMFEYAHLRAPLPKDLRGSEIFAPSATQSPPETYFLMRRSKDGYVSATGMFKIAFPWAKHAEEKAERDFLKSKGDTSHDEIAGNVWISPLLALELADEYQMTSWVKALLDPEEIVQSPSNAKKHISPPPKFELHSEQLSLAPPTQTSAKGRARRSASPSKIASPTKKIASPRKRTTKAMKEANAAAAAEASESLQAALDTAASEPPSSVPPESTTTVDDKVKIEVETSTSEQNGLETTTTNVTVEMPAGSPELPLPEDTEKMLEKAKQMVEEAQKLESEGAVDGGRLSRKRKADSAAEDDLDGALPVQPAKKAKVLEEKLQREKVRNRALAGVTVTLAIAAAIPYFF